MAEEITSEEEITPEEETTPKEEITPKGLTIVEGIPRGLTVMDGPLKGLVLENLRDRNLMHLKRLNDAVFRIPFSDQYYSHAVDSSRFTKLAYYCEEYVGSITCRLERYLNGVSSAVCIMTLGVLAPYRRLGIGTMLLSHVFDLCQGVNIGLAYLNVQTDNEYAIKFFQKFGFEMTQTKEISYVNSRSLDSHKLIRYFDHQAPS